ncbi:cytochrome-c peroxidase [Paucibacter aquatile]|uniref:Cytochrome-c peroxidase n=2 Tax=Kinneretia aquatilis TaxID=2070761 RepID=A0A2N8L010_9BURK|nr:cytochrome-c peroxidase [Paucibacter aquatile]
MRHLAPGEFPSQPLGGLSSTISSMHAAQSFNSWLRQRSALALSLVLLLGLSACGGGGGGGASPTGSPTGAASSPGTPASSPSASKPLSLQAQLGEKIFHDRNLSGSGRMSCATCHDPAFFHGPPNTLPVQVGGAFETEFGTRAAPSLRYLETLPAFNGTPQTLVADLRGGLMADGRADSLAAQAKLPWFNPREMDNGDAATLARKLRAAAYASDFGRAFPPAAGASAPDDDSLVTQASQALQSFQVEDPRFHPYDSKFDWVQQGRAQFSNAEARGLRAFNDTQRGHCASCHPSFSLNNQPIHFTNFAYAALAVPRNRALQSTADATAFDLGLCQSPHAAVKGRNETCGFFRTPGLRNVEHRPVFFHNGSFTSLEQVLRFYATRDTDPAQWYPTVAGQLQLYDDLPLALHANVESKAPFGPRRMMSDSDIADILCFLRTLSDGYTGPATPPSPGCN